MRENRTCLQFTPAPGCRVLHAYLCRWQVNNQSDAEVKEKVFSALVLAVQTLQRKRATILNALVRMKTRWASILTHAQTGALLGKVIGGIGNTSGLAASSIPYCLAPRWDRLGPCGRCRERGPSCSTLSLKWKRDGV